jgi:NADPH:quinone reductase-like Zn-dependent oxidoreductase
LVGGPLLAAAVQRIQPGGQIVSYGMSSEEATSLRARSLYLRNAASISGFLLFDELVGFGGGAATLARLLALVADGSLDPGVSTVADWHDVA